MRLGHFHLHSRAVYRSSGHSAVAAAAYQANETLAHEKKNRGSVSLDFRKELNKGHISQGLRTALNDLGIELSDSATASKDGRRDWTITDGEAVYAIREYRQTTVNKDTGKQETLRQVLDVYADRTYDYSRKGDMVAKWMQAPEAAPAWIHEAAQRQDRQGFWNAAEAAERNRNGRPARTIEMALSRDLSMEENQALVRDFVRKQLTDKGLVADVAIHSKTASDGRQNIHAHILFTTREIDAGGDFADTKDDYWNSRERIKEFRRAWAAALNDAYQAKGLAVRVDHRSYHGSGIDKEPGEHLGPAAWHMEGRGHSTRKGRRNRAVKQENAIGDYVRGMEADITPWDMAHADLVPAAPRPSPPAPSPAREKHEQAIADYLRGMEPDAATWNVDPRPARPRRTPPVPSPERDKHESAIAAYMRSSFHRSVRANVEFYARIERFAERAVDAARNLFDRYMRHSDAEARDGSRTWVERVKGRTPGKDAEYER